MQQSKAEIWLPWAKQSGVKAYIPLYRLSILYVGINTNTYIQTYVYFEIHININDN